MSTITVSEQALKRLVEIKYSKGYKSYNDIILALCNQVYPPKATNTDQIDTTNK